MSGPAYPCAACGLRVHAASSGSGATCPACGWIDDFAQLAHPDLVYGANSGMSLRQAQLRARERPASKPAERASYGREALWRPLRPGETPSADPQGPSSPVCELTTPDLADFVPYWQRDDDVDDGGATD